MRISHTLTITLVLASLLLVIHADVYLHNPRGSNNRCRETNANRQNEDRLFDSENNAKGGYAAGPALTYYEDSLLHIEWTSQHGCGIGHTKVDCEIILQYMCHPKIRDGLVTGTVTEATMDDMELDDVTGQQAYTYGMHEPFTYWDKCNQRDRNGGLWIADQNRRNDRGARVTRQDNANAPDGFECGEERDYYPYWHPTPWRDIAVLTADANRCDYFKSESQNVKSKNECSLPKYNNAKECIDNDGKWNSVSGWGVPPPECIVNGFSRDNHLGNTKTGYTNSYGWVIPPLSQLNSDEIDGSGDTATCVFRIRYNISTSDVDGWRHVDRNADMLDSDSNGEQSPVRQNPVVPYGSVEGQERHLRLAINTAQFGRTFQDRSHMFKISKRPDSIAAGHRLFNLNVRGKRGNIVQVYPAVEYDFVPNDLRINAGDYVHFQWTGSDFNPQGNDGEGTNGSDRSNVVQITNSRDNKPTPLSSQTLFSPAKALWMAHINQYDGKNCKSVDEQNCCYTEALEEVEAINDQDPRNCKYLNDPDAEYFDGGVVQMQELGVYNFMSTRNNNFSNRSQKGKITVGTLLPVWGIIVASVAGLAFIAATVVAGGVYFAQTHPQSSVANIFGNVRI